MDINATNFLGKEVSCQAIEVLFDELPRKGLPPTVLTAGTNYAVEYLSDKEARIEWAGYRQIMANAGKIWSEAELIDLGRTAAGALPLPSVIAMAQLCASVQAVYHCLLASGISGLAFFLCFKTTWPEAEATRLILNQTMAAGYPPSPEHFLMLKGILAAIPTLAGFRPADVEMRAIEGGFCYEIHLAKTGGILTTLRRLITRPLAVWTATRELYRANMALQERELALQAQTIHLAELEQTLQKHEATQQVLLNAAQENVTARHQAEEALEEALDESRSRFQALFDNAQEAILLTDDQAGYVDANPAACKLLGYRREELLQLHIWDITLSPNQEMGQQLWQQFIAAGQQQGEFTVLCKDGSTVETEYRAVANIIPGLHLSVLRDIRTRKQVVAALQASEERFRLIVENIPVLINAYGQDGTFIFWNRQCEEATGYSSAEIIGNPRATEYLYPDENFRRQVMAEWVSQGNIFSDWEMTLTRKDGRQRTISWSNISDRVPVSGWKSWAVGIDVTDRKQAEAEVQRREQEFRSLADNLPDIIARFDRQLRHLFVNRQIEATTGIPAQLFLGRTHQDLTMPTDLVDYWGAALREVFNTGQPKTIEFTFMAEAGEEMFESRLIPEFGPNGTVETVLGINRNVTARRRAEVALKESEARYRSLFENALEGIFRSVPEGHFVDVNPALVRMLGYDRLAEVLALRLPDDLYVDPAEREQIRAAYEDQGVLLGAELIWKRKDGQLITVSVDARVIRDDQGAVVCYEGMVQDITARKQAEEQLRQSLREKQLLLQEIHHRVKNNLQLISSMLSLQSDSVDNEEVWDTFSKSQRRIKSLALIHEELYRSEDLTDIHFTHHIQNLVKHLFLSYGANERRIEFENQIGDIALGVDQAIPCSLIVNELVSNALKHAFPLDDPRLGTELPKISVALTETADQMYRLVVSDNGIGLPELIELEEINSLGLRLIKALVRQLGGSFDYQSQAGMTCQILFKMESRDANPRGQR